MKNNTTGRFALLSLLLGLTCLPAGAATFTVSFPSERSAQPLDGRLILLLSRDFEREPRSHVAPNEPLASPYLFGLTVERLADGRTPKLPPDKGEGQQWWHKPGNLYSKPIPVDIDPGRPARTALVLDQEMPGVEEPKDTEFVRHIRIRSELLSRFWGRDVYLGAHVLVPKGFDTHTQAHYPLMVFHGHFPDDISEFRDTPPDPNLKPVYSNRFHLAGYNRIEQEEAYKAYQKWISATEVRRGRDLR